MTTLLSFADLARARYHWLLEHNCSYHTANVAEQTLFRLAQWANLQGLAHPSEITQRHLKLWQSWLSEPRPSDGHLWSSTFQEAVTAEVLRTLQWAYEQGFLLIDPTTNLERPKVFQTPQEILSWQDLIQLYEQLDTTTLEGMRDGAMLEVCYSTALNDAELLNLRLEDIDRFNNQLIIRPIHDNPGRVVPIHEKVVEVVDLYTQKVRNLWKVKGQSRDFLFLDAQGQPLSQAQFTAQINQYLKAVKPNLKASPELLQNSVITLMFELGMDLVFLPFFLGYIELSQIQTTILFAG